MVGFVELTRAGQLVNNSIFDPLLVFMSVAVIYFALCFPLSWWSRKFEDKLGQHVLVQAAMMAGEPMSAVVKVKDVHKSFGTLKVLNGVSFERRARQVVAVIGRSGSGKSTMLRSITGWRRSTADRSRSAATR